MTDPIRAAAQALLAAIDCKYIDECDAEINAMRAALSSPQPERTYTHAEVRRWLNELSAAAKSFGLEVVSTITGPNESVFGLRRIDPQPAADERVAEHIRLVQAIADEAHANGNGYGEGYWLTKQLSAVESSARALLAAGLEDAEMLNAIEAHTHTNWELSYTREPEDDEPWEVYARTGPVNDQEWNLIAKGKTVREAIRAAMKGTP